MRLAIAAPQRQGRVIEGQVIHVDRFGNLITNIPAEALPQPEHTVVEIAGGRIHGLRRTYGDADEGEVLALVGSFGYLEVAVNGGSAAQRLAAGRGARVRVYDGISSL